VNSLHKSWGSPDLKSGRLAKSTYFAPESQ
jgi:hypothetical protein